MNDKGQSILAEHTMIFFVVIAALLAMTTYVQRAYEARIHDARNFMINAVLNSGVCDANCMAAAGGNVYLGYDPYYLQQVSGITSHARDKLGVTSGKPIALGVIFNTTYNEASSTVATSLQIPPECMNGGNANWTSICANLQ